MGKAEAAISRMIGHRVYLDTNVFVYFLDRNPDFFRIVSPIVQAVDAGRIIGLPAMPL